MTPSLGARRVKPRIPKARRVKFAQFKSGLLPAANSAGDFLLLPERKNMDWVVNPENWRSKPGRIRTEHFRGHKGLRRYESFQVEARKPNSNLSRTLIFKPAQIPNQRFQELYGLVKFRSEARVVTETPVGMCRHKGTWYTVTLREPGKTLKKIGGDANGSVVDAARIYGRAFNAGLLQGDAGPKHLLASKKRLRLFDLEFARRARNRTEGLGDFRAFFVLAVEERLISDRAKAMETIGAFSETTGLGVQEVTALIRRAIIERQKMREEFHLKKPLAARVFGEKYGPLERMLKELR
jgi:hypothetical protein